VALSRLAQRVAQRDGPHILQRVALSDGAEALQQPLMTHVPEYILILDSIHATEYLWDTATALLGKTHPQRTAWVRAYLAPLLAGQTNAVITALEAEGHDPTHTAAQRQTVRRMVGYYRRNRPDMRYDEYLAHGWPIGTGEVEGACWHLVKDRVEPSGIRWTTGGAQGVLDLRAVRLNGHWDVYWPFHRQHPTFRTSLSGMSHCEVPTESWSISSPAEESPMDRHHVYRRHVLDPLGLVAGRCDARGIGTVMDHATQHTPEMRLVTAGHAVNALVRNGLGCVPQPLDLGPRVFQDQPPARRLAPGVLDATPLNNEALGRAVDPLDAAGVTARARLMAATAAGRLGLTPRLAPLERPSGQVDGREHRDHAPDAPVGPSPRGARRDPRPDLPHVMLAWLGAHHAGMPVRRQPRRGQRRDAPACGHVVRAHLAPWHTPDGPTARVAARARARGHPATALRDAPAMAHAGPSDLA
jgi:hypothetical protein